MEDSLGRGMAYGSEQFREVLILVVMEDSLGRLVVTFIQWR